MLHEEILVPALRRRIGVSLDIFGNYDAVYKEGSERHEVKDSAGSQVSMVYCFAVDCKNDSN